MDINNQKLRDGIIAKLKQYNAYIDNELPDYIIVMLANKKTMLQIKNDLQLFLGNNTDAFSDWLQRVASTPELLEDTDEGELKAVSDEEVDDSKPKVITLPGTKEKKASSELHIRESQGESMMSRDTAEGEIVDESRRSDRLRSERDGQRSRLTMKKRSHNVKPDSTRDQDLRAFIAQRREERNKQGKGGRYGHYDNDSESSEDEKERVSTSLSSVVKIMKRPQLGEKGGGRLLQKALLGLGRKRPSDETEEDVHVPKVKVARREEGGVVKRVLRVKKEDLDKFLSTKKSPKKTAVSQVSSTEPQEVRRGEGVESSEGSDAGDQVVIELERDSDDIQDQIIERATIAAVKSVLPMAARLGRKRKSSEQADLRELIRRRTSSSESTRFVVTLDGTDDPYQDDDLEDKGTQNEQDAHGNVRERCRFWPNCKNGDSCSYIHPTVPCKLFPDCKYGKRCLYVHPQCKFDSRCTRSDCPYLHTAPRHLALKPTAVPMPSPVPMFKPKFGPTFSYLSSSGGGQKFPEKSALTWTPNKSPHNSERKFAVPDDQTTSVPV
ncbi:zinc finger CCCH domain-containing protein 14-like [Halichondria panicea]|uniref:zinc finger CCCH domain-containing protein 14-like n=1 Tax=Halichondria panicea TaxID=6063 RepID=UPI00312B7E26